MKNSTFTHGYSCFFVAKNNHLGLIPFTGASPNLSAFSKIFSGQQQNTMRLSLRQHPSLFITNNYGIPHFPHEFDNME